MAVNFDEPRLLAGVALARRTGAREVQIRFSDDEQPVVWMAVACYSVLDGHPRSTGKINAYKVGAGFEPVQAVMALCSDAVDGAGCVHCGRPCGFDENFGEQPLDEYICWYQYDPELETFRRGCEGGT
jgi:hypothetical protein